MKKIVLSFIFFFFMTNLSFSDYFIQPIHSDKELGNIVIDEKEIRDVFTSGEQNLNIFLNYVKTLIFTNGYVTIEQDRIFKELLNKFTEKDRKTLEEFLKKILSQNNLEIKIIDLKSKEYFLPIDLFENGVK